jgi:hypothetical protein
MGLITETNAQYYTGNNYGSYIYISLDDIINNFLVAYVGADKLIPSVKRTDVMFHAKRGLQEFSYDTLKVIKSQELTIPPSLSLAIPQDYVNYVKLSWIDDSGAKHIIYPTRVTSNPTELPIQDNSGIPTQDQTGSNLLSQQSLTEERWENISSTTNNQPDDYRVPDRFAALRNAKIRLSNIKIEEISQVFRNKAKWIKH